MRIKIHYNQNPHQKKFQDDCSSFLLHLSSGFGGGKTYALIMKLVLLSKLNLHTHGGLVCPDFQEFKKDVLPEMEQILQRNGIRYRYHGSDHYFEFPWTKMRLYVVSAEKPIRGPNWGYAGINEVTLIPLVRYKEVIGRVRDKRARNPQIVSVGTPEGFMSEYYEYFIEKPPVGLNIIYGSTDDNSHNLHESYIPNLEAAYDTKMIETFRHGLWVNMATNRFYYSHDPKKCEDLGLVPGLFTKFHCSMDFNVDPFCATLWGYDGFAIYGVDQIHLEGGQGYKTENMVQALDKKGYKPANTIIYPDPAGKARSTKGESDVHILRAANYEVRVKSVAPNFRRRQLNVNNLLDKLRIKYNPNACAGIRKDFIGVEQDPITLEKMKANPKLTHFSDGLDYMTDILFPFSGDAKATTVGKLR